MTGDLVAAYVGYAVVGVSSALVLPVGWQLFKSLIGW